MSIVVHLAHRLSRCTSGAGALSVLLASCALPPIHRDNSSDAATAKREPNDAAADGAPATGLAADSDAGPVTDPEQDPANRNEDFETFLTLVPKAHVWAEWPMPDSAPHSKFKSSYTVSTDVITDDVTKLRWQRVLPDVYPGCTGHYIFVDRDRGPSTGCTWEEAQAYCARPELPQQLGGGTWRVPTKIELESLIDVSRVLAVDPLFDAFPVERMWTSSPVPNPESVKLAWSVDFMEGVSFVTGRFKAGRVRCVSSSNDKGGTAPNYQLNGEVVRDTISQLEWQRTPDSAARTWQDALAYCAGLTLQGDGWRLPSLKELLTLVDSAQRMPAIQRKTFLFTQPDRYWTSSEYLDGRDIAHQVEFQLGESVITGSTADQHYVRCTR